MTRKHFEEIAATLKNAKPTMRDANGFRVMIPGLKGPKIKGAEEQWAMTVRLLADMCSRQSGRFDRARFLKACGMEE